MINVSANLSTGGIAVKLCRMAEDAGHRSLLCYSRGYPPADVASWRIGSPEIRLFKWRFGAQADSYIHALRARLTDRCGFYSRHVTKKLIRQLEAYKPDLIHLHNLHGYYLNLPVLFDWLRRQDIPVLWTLHDCWAYTGHCAYYTLAKCAPEDGKRRRTKTVVKGCSRWIHGCHDCPLKDHYPSSWLLDSSSRNWKQKKEMYATFPHMILAVPSDWLRGELPRSFLKDLPAYTLPNGLDLDIFKPCDDERYMLGIIHYYGLMHSGGKKLVLSVAAVWDERKGLEDLIVLSQKLGDEYCVIAVGLDPNQIAAIPKNTVLGLKRTGNVKDLCALYTAADVYVSASREETMGMTLVEALACGTQVICYDATAMPEIVTGDVGRVVPCEDVDAMAIAVRELCDNPCPADVCRRRAADFDAEKCFGAYIRLYENMYRHSPAFASSRRSVHTEE